MAIQNSYTRIDGTINDDLARRDLEMAIHMCVWEDNPIQRMTRVGARPFNRHAEWHIRKLAVPSAVTSNAEAQTFSGASSNQPRMLAAGLHYDYYGYGVSGTDNALPLSYSGSSPLDDQGAIALREFVMQMDVNHLWSTYQIGNGSGTERQEAGLVQWLLYTGAFRKHILDESGDVTTGITVTESGAQVPYWACSHLAVNAQNTAMTAEILNTKLQAPRVAGVKVDQLTFFVSPETKQYVDSLMLRVGDVANYASTLRYERPMDNRLIGNRVDMIQTSWGIVPVVEILGLSGYTQAVAITGSTYDYTAVGNNMILGLRMSEIQQRVLRPYEEIEVGTTGDKTERYYVFEGMVQPGNPAEHFIYLNVDGTDDPTP